MDKFSGESVTVTNMATTKTDKTTPEPIKFVSEKLEENRRVKRSIEPDFNVNVSYYMGDQWVRYNKSAGILVPAMSDAQMRYTRNYIFPVVNSFTAKMTSTVPRWIPNPKDSSSSNINAARTARYVLEDIMLQNNFDSILQQACPIVACAGSIVIHPYFNKNVGKKYKAEDINAAAGYEAWQDDQSEGAVELDVLTPFEVCYDIYSDNIEKSEYILISKVRSVDWVHRVYDKTVKAQDVSELKISEAFYRFRRSVSPGYELQTDYSNSTIVHECWQKPNAKFPKGRLVTVTDTKEVLYDGELPWGLDEAGVLPFVKLDYTTVPGRFWGIAPVSMCRESQRKINKTISQFEAFKTRAFHFKIMRPINSGISDDQFNDNPGEIIDFVPASGDQHGGAAYYLNPPQVNPQWNEGIYDDRQYIYDVFGIHDVSQSKAPMGGPRSGKGIAILQSQDDTRMHPIMVQWSQALGRLGSICLQIAEKTYKIPRLVGLCGKINARRVKDFTGDMLQGNTRVTVDMGSSLPMNQIARIDIINEWFDRGIIPHTPEGYDWISEVLEFGTEKRLYEGGKDREQAEYENSILDEGKPCNVHDWDMDDVHLKTHEDREKEIEFIDLIEKNPTIFQAYQEHITQHRERLLNKEQLSQGPMPTQENMEQMQQQIGPDGMPIQSDWNQGEGVMPEDMQGQGMESMPPLGGGGQGLPGLMPDLSQMGGQ